MNKLVVLLLFLHSISNSSFSNEVDSLLNIIKKSKSDTQIVSTYGRIGVLCEIEDIPSFSNTTLQLIEKKKINSKHPDYKFYQTEKARAYNNLGYYYYFKLNTIKSIDAYQKAILILEEIESDDDLLASLYNNVSSQYMLIKNYRKPIEYLHRVIAIDKKNKSNEMLALDYNNLASAYYYIDKKDSCIWYGKIALELRKKIGDKVGETNVLYNLASNYYKWKEYKYASEYFNRAHNSFINLKVVKDSSQLITMYHWEAKWRRYKNDLHNAEINLKKAFNLCFRTERYTEIAEITYDLYSLYKKLKNDKNALQYLEKYNAIVDSSNNAFIDKQVSLKEAKFEYEKEAILLKLEQQKKLAIEQEKRIEQKKILYVALLGLLITLVLFVIIYNRWKLLLKQKKIIEQQQRQLVQQQLELHDSNTVLEIKNSTIREGINAALYFQNALLPSKRELNELLGLEHFLFFKPKDLVSGDFYQVKKIDKFIYIVIADCVGHGVSGAFIGVLSIKIIDKIIANTKPQDLAKETLLQLHSEFKNSFEKSNESGIGIDLVVAVFDTENYLLRLSGSGNKVIVKQGDEFITINFKNLQLGKLNHALPEFEVEEIKLSPNDLIYASTDGYIDQVGDESKKKFSNARFLQLLHEISHLSLNEQGNRIEQTFEKWKGAKEQYDDVCVLGWRV